MIYLIDDAAIKMLKLEPKFLFDDDDVERDVRAKEISEKLERARKLKRSNDVDNEMIREIIVMTERQREEIERKITAKRRRKEKDEEEDRKRIEKIEKEMVTRQNRMFKYNIEKRVRDRNNR